MSTKKEKSPWIYYNSIFLLYKFFPCFSLKNLLFPIPGFYVTEKQEGDFLFMKKKQIIIYLFKNVQGILESTAVPFHQIPTVRSANSA